jgi:hypothetical protein
MGAGPSLPENTVDDETAAMDGQPSVTVGLSVTLSSPPLRW